MSSLMARVWLRRIERNEDGSVILAMLVVLVATLAITALLISVTNGLDLSRNDQNRTNAFQYANGGVDQALYRLDKQKLPTTGPLPPNYTPVIVSGVFVGFDETVTSGSGPSMSSYKIEARESPAGQTRVWTVRSTGTDRPGGRQRQAIATIQATPLFQNGFFTLRDFSISGQQTTPIAYHSETCPDPRTMTLPDCNLAQPVPGFLGTNGTFGDAKMSNATVEAFKANWEGFNMYGKTSQAAADAACAQGRCAPKAVAITDPLVVIVPKPPATAINSCPNFSIPVAPGDYLCSSITFPAAPVTVSGSTGDVRIWVSGPISMQKDTVVNAGQPTRRFQIFQATNPNDPNGVWPGSICDAEFWGLLYAPGLSIDCTGDHEPTIYGSVVADFHGGTGNQFNFHWDLDAQNIAHDGKYVIKNWRECPPTSVNC